MNLSGNSLHGLPLSSRGEPNRDCPLLAVLEALELCSALETLDLSLNTFQVPQCKALHDLAHKREVTNRSSSSSSEEGCGRGCDRLL